MIQLLKFEWRKLWQQKSLYVIFGLGLLSIVLFMTLGKVLYDVFDTPSGNALASMLVVLPNDFAALFAIYLALFVCADFSQQTIKNIYARGYSRNAVFFTKYLVSLGVTLAVAIIYMAFSFVYALILGGFVAKMPGYMWGSLALQFWVLIGLHGTYFGISMMIGKTGGSVAVNLFGVSFVIGMLALLISLTKVDFNLSDYDLENILTTLMGDKLTTAQLVRALVMPPVYAVAFIGGGWLVNNRREV